MCSTEIALSKIPGSAIKAFDYCKEQLGEDIMNDDDVVFHLKAVFAAIETNSSQRLS